MNKILSEKGLITSKFARISIIIKYTETIFREFIHNNIAKPNEVIWLLILNL